MTVQAGGPDYPAAARRHGADARLLFAADRYASADHLAGFAVECLLKHVQVSYFGFSPTSGGPPIPPKPQKGLSGHLPKLWDEMALLVQGRTAPRLSEVLTTTTPFSLWTVDDRYSDGSKATPEVVRNYLHALTLIAGIIEQAELDGDLP